MTRERESAEGRGVHGSAGQRTATMAGWRDDVAAEGASGRRRTMRPFPGEGAVVEGQSHEGLDSARGERARLACLSLSFYALLVLVRLSLASSDALSLACVTKTRTGPLTYGPDSVTTRHTRAHSPDPPPFRPLYSSVAWGLTVGSC